MTLPHTTCDLLSEAQLCELDSQIQQSRSSVVPNTVLQWRRKAPSMIPTEWERTSYVAKFDMVNWKQDIVESRVLLKGLTKREENGGIRSMCV